MFFFTIRLHENLVNIGPRTWCEVYLSGVKVSDEWNQDVLGIEANCTMSRGNMEEWIEEVKYI